MKKGLFSIIFENSKTDITRLMKKLFLSFKKFTKIRTFLGQKPFDKIFIDDPNRMKAFVRHYKLQSYSMNKQNTCAFSQKSRASALLVTCEVLIRSRY